LYLASDAELVVRESVFRNNRGDFGSVAYAVGDATISFHDTHMENNDYWPVYIEGDGDVQLLNSTATQNGSGLVAGGGVIDAHVHGGCDQ